MQQDLISDINAWFARAVPNPTTQNKSVQFGCHFEELSEMANEIMRGAHLCNHLANQGANFKSCQPHYVRTVEMIAESKTRSLGLRDALCDQIVTAIGIYHMMGWDIKKDLAEVNRSNWSKFENGKPVFDENGKIQKGANYTPPTLE